MRWVGRALLALTLGCGPPAAHQVRYATVETELATIDVPAGWDTKVFVARGNPVVWLSPPVDQHGRGRLVTVTASDAPGQPDLEAVLTRLLARDPDDDAQGIDAVTTREGGVTCIERATSSLVSAACGVYRATPSTSRALVWAFVLAVDAPFYRAIGGSAFLAAAAASMRDFALPAAVGEPGHPTVHRPLVRVLIPSRQ